MLDITEAYFNVISPKDAIHKLRITNSWKNYFWISIIKIRKNNNKFNKN